jgi:RND family efflux transporter MFP subunit
MKKKFWVAVALILSMAAVIVGWGAWLNYSDEDQIARRMVSRSVELTAAKAARRQLTPTVLLDAIRFSSDSMTDAMALTEGRIVHWNVEKNDEVRQGDVLASMVNENIPLKIQQAESAIARADAMLAQAKSNYERQGRLLDRRATSQAKFEEAEAQYLAAQGGRREAQAQLDQLMVQQDWLNVRSPLDGEILIVYQREGSYVQAGTPVALVGDFTRLSFSMNVADEDARHLEVGATGFLSFPARKVASKAYDTNYGRGNRRNESEARAVLKEVVPPLSEPADIRRLVWEVDNRARVFEPMVYTGITIRIGKPYEALTVPLAAMMDKAYNQVFVVDGGGILHSRRVATGAYDDTYIEVYDGLSEGETVVVGNMDGLEDGMRVEAHLEGET